MDINKLCPVVGSYPAIDATKNSGRQLNAALDKTTIAHDIKIYPGALHSFMNDRIPFFYNEEAATDSWQRTLAFFDEHLAKN
jgi:carboxymethylenebutenolidase